MATQLDICNLALTNIGQRTIASLQEASQNARIVAQFYDLARDTTLRSAAWNFATKVAPLGQIANESSPGWSYLYIYPADCVTVRRVNPNASTEYSNRPIPFKILRAPLSNVKVVACNIAPAYIEYTYNAEDPADFDPLFTEAMALRLSSYSAFPLTGDRALAESLVRAFEKSISDAKLQTSNEGLNIPTQYSGFVDSR